MLLIIVVSIIGVCLHGLDRTCNLSVAVALFLNRPGVDIMADRVVLVGTPEL